MVMVKKEIHSTHTAHAHRHCTHTAHTHGTHACIDKQKKETEANTHTGLHTHTESEKYIITEK